MPTDDKGSAVSSPSTMITFCMFCLHQVLKAPCSGGSTFIFWHLWCKVPEHPILLPLLINVYVKPLGKAISMLRTPRSTLLSTSAADMEVVAGPI